MSSPGANYQVKRRQVRSLGAHDERIKECISGGKELKNAKTMTSKKYIYQLNSCKISTISN